MEKKAVFLIYRHCAPVFYGICTGNTVTLPAKEMPCLLQIIQKTALNFQILQCDRQKTTVFVYRPALLSAYLDKTEVKTLLREFGYKEQRLIANLERLSERFSAYQQKKMAFPHELGLFLQYPPEDVKQFILHKGKNFLFSGYWKVYAHAAEAAKVFDAYDKARAVMFRLLQKGIKMRDLYINRNVT